MDVLVLLLLLLSLLYDVKSFQNEVNMPTPQNTADVHIITSGPMSHAPTNPLIVKMEQAPLQVTAILGMNFIYNLRTWRKQCYKDIRERQSFFEGQINEVIQLQRRTNVRLRLTYPNMAQEQRQTIFESFHNGIGNIIREEEKEIQRMNEKCAWGLKDVTDERMLAALIYTRSKLLTGISDFITFVNDVSDYGHELEQGLYQCVERYGSVFLRQSQYEEDICMELEIQELVKFTYDFVFQAMALLNIAVDDSNAFFDHIDKTFPRPTVISIKPQLEDDDASQAQYNWLGSESTINNDIDEHFITDATTTITDDEPFTDTDESVTDEHFKFTNKSITDEPFTDEPITDESDEPITDDQEPITDEPFTDELIEKPFADININEPITDESLIDEPFVFTNEPITDEPITDAPDEPITDNHEPITDESITDEPINIAEKPFADININEPITDESFIDEPFTFTNEANADEPIADDFIIEPIAITDEPITDEHIIDEPINNTDKPFADININEPINTDESFIGEPFRFNASEPITDEPIIDEPIINGSIIDEPIIDEPIINGSIIDEPIIDEPIINGSIIDEPIIDEPIINRPIVDEPITDEPNTNTDEHATTRGDKQFHFRPKPNQVAFEYELDVSIVDSEEFTAKPPLKHDHNEVEDNNMSDTDNIDDIINDIIDGIADIDNSDDTNDTDDTDDMDSIEETQNGYNDTSELDTDIGGATSTNDNGTSDAVTSHAIASDSSNINTTHVLLHRHHHILHVDIYMVLLMATVVLIVCVVSILLFACALYPYCTRGKDWSRLNEEEKVALMKQSGYVNPAYKFFDRVTAEQK